MPHGIFSPTMNIRPITVFKKKKQEKNIRSITPINMTLRSNALLPLSWPNCTGLTFFLHGNLYLKSLAV